jgi:FAD/FMN-containing dehydrogenase
VTADGEQVTASAEDNPELLCALRGGGGNFGVVTSFEYRLHPLGPGVIAGGVVHSFADAPEVFRFFADYVASAPDELSVTASTFRAPPGFPCPPSWSAGYLEIAFFSWRFGRRDRGRRHQPPTPAPCGHDRDSYAPRLVGPAADPSPAVSMSVPQRSVGGSSRERRPTSSATRKASRLEKPARRACRYALRI